MLLGWGPTPVSTSAFLFLFCHLLALTLKRPLQYLKCVRDARVSFPFLGLFLCVGARVYVCVRVHVCVHVCVCSSVRTHAHSRCRLDLGVILEVLSILGFLFLQTHLFYFCLHICKCTTCMSGVYKGQKSLDPLEVMNICEPTCSFWAPTTALLILTLSHRSSPCLSFLTSFSCLFV